MGMIGKKIGMTQVFVKNGEIVPVTVVELGPCTVVQTKIPKTDGYSAVQLGFGKSKPKAMTKALRGHFEKKKLPLFTHLKEFRTDKAENFSVGDELVAEAFKAGDTVHVTGITKGRGFQGVMRRHGKHGGPGSHGSDFHRRPGSIGMRTWPARIPKNMGLPGHMGDEQVTVKGLEIVDVKADDNVVLIKGSVPGTRGGILYVTLAGEGFEDRPELKRKEEKAKEPQPEKAKEEQEERAAERPAEQQVNTKE